MANRVPVGHRVGFELYDTRARVCRYLVSTTIQ